MSVSGMTATVLATGLAEAVAKDEAPDEGGCDISAGLYGPHASQWLRDVANAIAASRPIDMILYCPVCGMQHIDAPEEAPPRTYGCHHSHATTCGNCDPIRGQRALWTNPPHRSHLCHECGHIWRPADVPTNGVQAIKTKGRNDTPLTKI